MLEALLIAAGLGGAIYYYVKGHPSLTAEQALALSKLETRPDGTVAVTPAARRDFFTSTSDGALVPSSTGIKNLSSINGVTRFDADPFPDPGNVGTFDPLVKTLAITSDIYILTWGFGSMAVVSPGTRPGVLTYALSPMDAVKNPGRAVLFSKAGEILF